MAKGKNNGGKKDPPKKDPPKKDPPKKDPPKKDPPPSRTVSGPEATEEQTKKAQQKLRKIQKKKDTSKEKLQRQKQHTKALKKELKHTTGDKARKNLKKELKSTRAKKQDARQDLKAQRKDYRNARWVKTSDPGSAGELAPTTDPFLTADDLEERAATENEYNQNLAALDYALENLRIDTESGKVDVENARVAGLKSTNDDAAARGIFNSSIRDANLFDVESTAAVNRSLLDRRFDAQVLANQTQKLAYDQAWQDFQSAQNRKAVENAQEVDATQSKYLVDPVAATTGYARVNPAQHSHRPNLPPPRDSQTGWPKPPTKPPQYKPGKAGQGAGKGAGKK